MKSRDKPEETQPTLPFGLHQVGSVLSSRDGIVHAGVLERERKRRNYIHEIKDINDDEDGGTRRDYRLRVRREALLCARSQEADEKPPQHQTQGSAEQKDQASHGAEHHGQDENHETKQRKKKQAELKLTPRVLAFELFVGDESCRKQKIKRPAYPKGATTEVKNHESAQQAAEEKLQDIDEPGVDLRGPIFSCGSEILLTTDPQNAERDDHKMNHDPEIFPEHVNALQCDSVKDKAADKGNRGEGELISRVAGGQPARMMEH